MKIVHLQIDKNNILILYLLFSFNLFNISFAQEAEVKHERLTGPIYLIQCEGGNMAASIGDDGILLIDTDWERNISKIIEALKSIKDCPVRYVINTHYHVDHVGGNAALGASSTIIAHANARELLQKSLDAYDGYHFDPIPERGLPDITFENRLTLHFNNENVELRYMPEGHTDTDIIIWFPESRIVHLGDIFRHKRLPYLDVVGGATVQGFIKNLKTLVSEIPDDYTIIPGHGTLATKVDFDNYCQRFFDAVQHIQNLIDQGKSLEEVKQTGLPQFYDNYPPSAVEPDMWIEIVYKNLRGEL
jgi:glyoxylase-like metal-dependent hydrolase (beta-lactamase superfamily II)